MYFLYNFLIVELICYYMPKVSKIIIIINYNILPNIYDVSIMIKNLNLILNLYMEKPKKGKHINGRLEIN